MIRERARGLQARMSYLCTMNVGLWFAGRALRPERDPGPDLWGHRGSAWSMQLVHVRADLTQGFEGRAGKVEALEEVNAGLSEPAVLLRLLHTLSHQRDG